MGFRERESMGTLREPELHFGLARRRHVSWILHEQVTTDYLDRLRQMKARMTGIKTRVETVSAASESQRIARCQGVLLAAEVPDAKFGCCTSVAHVLTCRRLADEGGARQVP